MEKHSASELRAMLKEHKKSMPRLSAKKHELVEYAGKIGLLKAADPPPPPEPPAQKKKLATTVVAPVASELPKELKKPVPKQTKTTEPPKGGLAAYASFVAEGKARGLSHKEAMDAWKARK